MHIELIHASKKHSLEIPTETCEDPECCPSTAAESAETAGGEERVWTVGRLREVVAEVTNVPVPNQRLIHRGKSIIGDSTPISSLKLKDGDKLMVLSIKPLDDPNLKSLKKLESTNLKSIAGKLKELEGQIVGMEKGFLETKHFRQACTKIEKSVKLQAEECMRTLEKMDSMVLGAEGDSASKLKRKSLVKEVQGHLSRADDLLNRLCVLMESAPASSG